MRMNSNLLDPALLADINGPDRSGVLLIGEYSNDLAQFVRNCMHPLILVDIMAKGQPDVVTTDNFQGISEAFAHLRQLGHHKIGYIGRCGHVMERYIAWKLNMAEHGLPIRNDWVYDGYDHIEETAVATAEILKLSDRPTALICANDCYALGVVRAAARLGVSIPQQLSVTGFDDVDFASFVTPPLTTVRVPIQEMGRQAVRQLMIQVKGGTPTKSRGCHVRLLPELVVRESTAAVPA
jgi:DNA-binding LacI/PurR family transcriptional regulator